MAIRIECPKCRRELSTSEAEAGSSMRCPTCGTPFAVPGPTSFKGIPVFAKASRDEPTHDERLCPYCSEAIKATAIKCKHCGEFLDGHDDDSLEARPTRDMNRGIAAVLSLVIPGAGQMYRGHVLQGFVWLVCVYAGYLMLVFPGFVLHALCVWMASRPEDDD
jgi:predicted amidophosphoribosyltransferase